MSDNRRIGVLFMAGCACLLVVAFSIDWRVGLATLGVALVYAAIETARQSVREERERDREDKP